MANADSNIGKATLVSAVIVAAGSGTRMGPNIDKLFIEVGGRPVIAHTWELMDRSAVVDEVVLVIRSGMESAFRAIAEANHFRKPYRLVAGGSERQDSVWNGVSALSASSEIVLIQDGARPCTDHALIEQTVQVARKTGAAVAASRVVDTIKSSTDGTTIAEHLQRDRLWAVQTPQTFKTEVLRRALQAVRSRGVTVTDDTAACELIGQPVHLVPSEIPNPKVTTPADVSWVELCLKRRR